MGLLDFMNKSGLGAQMGGMGSGMGGEMTGAELAPQAAPMQAQGLLQGLPQQGQFQPQGFMSRMSDKFNTPDDRGRSIADKLFAAGSVMQGDSGGAATFLQNLTAQDTARKDKLKATGDAEAGLDALRNNIDPTTGQLNMRGYLAALPKGADPSGGFKAREALQPNVTPMNGSRGAVHVFNRDTGKFDPTAGIAGDPAPAGPLNPDGTPNMAYLNGESLEEEYKARGRRKGAPPAGPRPRAAVTSTGRPAGY